MLLALDDAVLIERLLARGRADDNEAVIRNRLEVYREKTAPLISFTGTRACWWRFRPMAPSRRSLTGSEQS